MKNAFSPRLIVAALTLSLGLAASSYAMPRGENRCPDMGRPGHHMMMHDGKGFGFGSGPGFARLHDELKLDAKQEALWQDADKFSKENFDGRRDQFRQHHEEMQAMLAKPNADLRAIAKRMDDLKAENQKLHSAVRDRWLNVYDALNPEQKEKARLFFKAGMERKAEMGERHGRRNADRPGQEPANQNKPTNAPASKN